MDLLSLLKSEYGDKVSTQLQDRFGMDPQQAQDILPRMAPMVLGGLKTKMQSPTDENSLRDALNTYGDESAVEDVEGHFQKASTEGAALPSGLSDLLGGSDPGQQQVMAKQLGVSPDMLGKLLPVLAPLILGAVTKNTRGVGRDPNSGVGGIGDILGSVLGGGGGANILGSVLGGGGGAAQQKSGCLSAILGGLMGGKR
jgi:hypothetical protein